MRMSNSPSPGSGVGLSVNSKLSRLGAPSGRLLSKIWRLILETIAILLPVATIKSKLMSAGAGEGISRPQYRDINKETGKVLLDTFGPSRVIGMQISRHGDGMTAERRPVKHASMLFYTVGRSYLLELYHSELQSGQIRIVDGPTIRRAYEQLMTLETEIRESGIVYTCPPGHHDDLGISCAMLAWAARHPHLPYWTNTAMSARRPRRSLPPKISPLGWT